MLNANSILQRSAEAAGGARGNEGIGLSEEYATLSKEELFVRIAAAKERLGRELVILGHHYQSDDVIQFADFRGDSLGLAQKAAAVEEVCYILFCGVRFMAETAAVVCGQDQMVLHPNPESGCPLADFAPFSAVKRAWEELQEAGVEDLIPVTYVNSSAEVKAFCGHNDGLACTSANSQKIVGWALERGNVLFMPDENLGRNTARALGLSKEELVIWDPSQPLGGNEPEKLRHSRLIIWKGHCYVHTPFSLEDVRRMRRDHPEAKIMVHPECLPAVVEAADDSGSTSQILRAVEEAPSGASFVIGTETNMVERLNREHPDKAIFPLRRSICGDMAKIDAPHLLYTLESLAAGRPINVVHLPQEIVQGARLALERMLRAG